MKPEKTPALGPSARSAELQLCAVAMRPWRAELELCAPMGDASAVLGNFHALWRRTAAWGLCQLLPFSQAVSSDALRFRHGFGDDLPTGAHLAQFSIVTRPVLDIQMRRV